MVWLAALNRALRFRRSTRRLLIVGAFAGYPLVLVGYSTLVATHRIDGLVWAPIAVALTALTGLGLLVIYRFVRDRAQLDNAHLDERERQLTTRAYTLSYILLSVIVLATVVVAALVLSFGGPITLRMEDVSPWIITVGVFLPALPSAALAWIEPEAVEDEAHA